MIELLIVISILGILAVAVLSAINPVEQINRGRDTGSQSDAEQLISAIDRYQAFQGLFPWQGNSASAVPVAWGSVETSSWQVEDVSGCAVLTRLGSTQSSPAITGCESSNEVKTSFVSRISASKYNTLMIYHGPNDGDSTYVCFNPLSDAFNVKAEGRCANDANSEYGALPDDFPTTNACADPYYYCLP